MTNDLALYKFGLFLISILAVILTLTLAFERKDIKATDWLLAGFTGLLAVFTALLVHVSSQQAEILSVTNEMSERPWVSLVGLPVITSPLILSPPGFTEVPPGWDAASVELKLEVTNSGHSPARRVAVMANLYETGSDLLREQEALWCRIYQAGPFWGTNFRDDLVPWR